jgi:hypothetical protein
VRNNPEKLGIPKSGESTWPLMDKACAVETSAIWSVEDGRLQPGRDLGITAKTPGI